jgi:hypothetical protein
MNDMTAVIVPKSDQINSDDFIAGPRTIRITGVDIRPGTEQPVSIHFEGDDGKPWKPCKSMSRVLVSAWGPDAKAYVGRSVTLYRDPNVTWGGMKVGGIRISHMTHIETELQIALTATKGKRAIAVIRPLAAMQDDAAPMLASIEACSTQADLRQWWTSHGESIPDASYDRVLAAFNARLAAVKRQPAPAAEDHLPEGRPESDHGEAFTGAEGVEA